MMGGVPASPAPGRPSKIIIIALDKFLAIFKLSLSSTLNLANILSLTEYELPAHECQKLEEQVRQAYKAQSPKISRLLRVLKDDPKQLVESLTTFSLDSGRKFLVIERLDKPAGLIAELIVQELTENGPTNERRYEGFGNLSPYCIAEREIMSLAIAEERAETD